MSLAPGRDPPVSAWLSPALTISRATRAAGLAFAGAHHFTRDTGGRPSADGSWLSGSGGGGGLGSRILHLRAAADSGPGIANR